MMRWPMRCQSNLCRLPALRIRFLRCPPSAIRLRAPLFVYHVSTSVRTRHIGRSALAGQRTRSQRRVSSNLTIVKSTRAA
jgi:hypothetical protein